MKAHISQIDPVEVEVGGSTFYIRPFGAFKANGILGELTPMLAPLIGSFVPLLMADGKAMDVDLGGVLPGVASAFGSLSNGKLEKVLKLLLTDHRNIAVDLDGEEDAEPLTADLADALFCGNAQDLYLLAAHVIRINFSGFFEKLTGLSGSPVGRSVKKMISNATGAST